jgi:hypothetical protein
MRSGDSQMKSPLDTNVTRGNASPLRAPRLAIYFAATLSALAVRFSMAGRRFE